MVMDKEAGNVVNSLSSLPVELIDPFRTIVEKLSAAPNVLCILLGGSASSTNVRPGADIDLWVISNKPRSTVRRVRAISNELNVARWVHEAGFYPWFGTLTTVYLSDDGSKSIDIGVCSVREAQFANPGPNVYVLWGDAKYLMELGRLLPPPTPDDSFSHLTSTLVKLRKAVRRGHLWNALAYLAQTRNDVLAIVMSKVNTGGVRYSRPEHGAESWMEKSFASSLVGTHATYDGNSILSSAAVLAALALELAVGTARLGAWHTMLSTLHSQLLEDALSQVKSRA